MSGNRIKQLEKELKKCKVGQWILFGTIVMILLVFFSLPLLKLFQPKQITIINQNGEKYQFSIPSDWVYIKFRENYYGFYDIWDKENMLLVTFYKRKKGMADKFLMRAKKEESALMLRELCGFYFLEIKKNPEMEKDDFEIFFIFRLNCSIYYKFKISKKEQILRKFLSHWKKIE